jgi:diphthamide synthase (EF-2-diphthine--ammonia ligase)
MCDFGTGLLTPQGHEVVALANLLPQPQQPDELDSYMFQTVRCSLSQHSRQQ